MGIRSLTVFGLLLLSFSGSQAALAATFQLREVMDQDAVCNNGEIANYWIARSESDDWLIQFPGGGSGWPASSFDDRSADKKSPARSSSGKRNIRDSAIADQFYQRGYNVVWLHYCSSDLYGGAHSNTIDGERVPFMGRRIVQSIVREHMAALERADDIVLAGTSAGAYGIILNIDLFADLEPPRLILDGIWRDDYQKSVAKPEWFSQAEDWIPYLFGDMPAHCNGDFYEYCWVDRPTLQRHNISEAFIIMNYGDPYNFVKDSSGREGFAAAMEEDARLFGGGFSVDAEKYELRGAVRWGHGLLTNRRDYRQKIGGESLQTLIGRWIAGESVVHTHY